MKRILPIFGLLLACSLGVRADKLNQQHVASDAQWLVHIDCDSLRETQVGGYLLTNLIGPKLDDMAAQFQLNLSNVLQHVNSLTAYGTEFKAGPEATGVLLIHSDADTQKVLEGALAAQILADTNGPVKQLQSTEQNLYSVANQVFIAPIKGGPIVISKSEDQIESTRELLSGKKPGLDAKQTVGRFPLVPNSFVFIAVANGAVDLPKTIPAQAKVLQMADGARVALGEKENKLFLDLALRGKTAEVTKQIQQVIEGMVALVSLGQPENADITDLAKSLKVASADQLISINVNYPADKAIAHLKDEMGGGAKKEKAQKVKNKAKAKAKVKAKSEHKAQPAEDEKPEAEPADSAKAEKSDAGQTGAAKE